MKPLKSYFNFSASIWNIFSIGACLLFSILGSIVSLHRYWQYEVFYFDFGIFDQAIWSVSRFKPPIIEHVVVGGKWIFADHFSPSIFILSPLYWFTTRSEILLIAQAVVVGLSGLVLYNIGSHLLKNRIASFSVLCSYFFFVGLQNAVITDFHEITLMTLSLMLVFWAIVKKRMKLYFLFLFTTLGFKESLFLLGVGIGLVILFIQQKWWKTGIFTIFFSVFWGLFSMKVIIPFFAQDQYFYSPVLSQTTPGILFSFIDKPEKLQTLFFSFASFGFLPLLSPTFWVAILQDYALRFIPLDFPTRWTLGLHYNAQSAVLLAVSTVYSLLFLKRRIGERAIIVCSVLLIFLSVVISVVILKSPFRLAFNKEFYKHSVDFEFLDRLVGKVPGNSTVMTQNNLASRFTHQKVWLLQLQYEKYKPEYIVFDIRGGQNPNNFFATKNPDGVIEKVQQDPNYQVIFQTDEQFVYRRKGIR